MDLSLEKLKEAVSIREQIDALQQRLSSIFGGGGQSRGSSSAGSSGGSSEATSTTTTRRGRGRGGRRQMSAETRAKLAEAARRRWASGGNIGNSAGRKSSGRAAGGGAKSGGGAKGGGAKGDRRLSPAGRKAISDAMKARWAARRAAKKS